MTENRRKELERIWGWIGKYKYAALVLLAGLLLMLWPAGQSEAAVGADREESQLSSFDLDAMERRIETALSQVDGVGQVTVVLTLQSGTERVLASDRQQGERQVEESTVVVSRGSGVQDTVTVQEIYPRFQGALVVCDGGNSPAVQLRVMESIAALTGLSSDKISICGRK